MTTDTRSRIEQRLDNVTRELDEATGDLERIEGQMSELVQRADGLATMIAQIGYLVDGR